MPKRKLSEVTGSNDNTPPHLNKQPASQWYKRMRAMEEHAATTTEKQELGPLARTLMGVLGIKAETHDNKIDSEYIISKASLCDDRRTTSVDSGYGSSREDSSIASDYNPATIEKWRRDVPGNELHGDANEGKNLSAVSSKELGSAIREWVKKKASETKMSENDLHFCLLVLMRKNPKKFSVREGELIGPGLDIRRLEGLMANNERFMRAMIEHLGEYNFDYEQSRTIARYARIKSPESKMAKWELADEAAKYFCTYPKEFEGSDWNLSAIEAWAEQKKKDPRPFHNWESPSQR